jgi:hypothetical protein
MLFAKHTPDMERRIFSWAIAPAVRNDLVKMQRVLTWAEQ